MELEYKQLFKDTIMLTLNQGALIIVLVFLIGYYGIVPLLNFDVYVRNSGWIKMESTQSLFNIIIGIVIWFVAKKLKVF